MSFNLEEALDELDNAQRRIVELESAPDYEAGVRALIARIEFETADVIKRALETTQAEADLAAVKRENEVLRERHAHTAEQLSGVRSTMQATIDTLRDRLQTTEHERWQLQVTLQAVKEDREEFRTALAEPLAEIEAYARRLRSAGALSFEQVCVDLLFLIGKS